MSGDDDWRSWIGKTGPVVPGPYPVSVAAIGYVAEAVEDTLLLERIARQGIEVAPPTFVNVAARVPTWQPESIKQPRVLLAASVPLPADAAVNRRVAQRYFHPLHIGDTVTSQSTLVSIEPKQTRLGDGFMVTEEIAQRNQDGVLVATMTNTAYRYDRRTVGKRDDAAAAPRSAARREERGPAGEALAPVVLPITTTMLAKAAGGVRDFIPLHHDVDSARRAGLPTTFAAWATLLAVLGRAVGEWFGLDADLRSVSLDMRTSVFLGRTLTCSGTVAPDPDEAGARRVDYALTTEDGTCVTGLIEVGPGR